MTRHPHAQGRLKPRITLTAADHERLSSLAAAAMNTMPDAAERLVEEIERAQVVGNGRRPADIVCMGCEVDFRDETTGKVQTVTLVYPDQADIAQGRISVLTPIGTALIGLHVGSSITWETRAGDIRRLSVLAVRQPQPA